jgi:hypothetical protein
MTIIKISHGSLGWKKTTRVNTLYIMTDFLPLYNIKRLIYTFSIFAQVNITNPTTVQVDWSNLTY